MNPDFFLFDHDDLDQGRPIQVRFAPPFAASERLAKNDIMAREAQGQAPEFSHRLHTQTGRKLGAGLLLAGFYEDYWDTQATSLNAYMPTVMATLAIKPKI